MKHQAIAGLLLASLAGMQGLGSILVDFNRTHASNPEWTGHARFHAVWKIATDALLAILAVALVFWSAPLSAERFYLAAALTAFPMLAFFAALFTTRLYGGSLHDENGIRPVPLSFHGKSYPVDLNAAVEVVAAVFLIGTVLVFRGGW